MSNRHPTHAARSVNGNLVRRADLSGLSPNRLYPGEAVVSKLGIGKNTLSKWVAEGLPVYGPNSRADLFLGREVIKFVTSSPKSNKEALRQAARLAAAKRAKKE